MIEIRDRMNFVSDLKSGAVLQFKNKRTGKEFTIKFVKKNKYAYKIIINHDNAEIEDTLYTKPYSITGVYVKSIISLYFNKDNELVIVSPEEIEITEKTE